MKEKVYIGEIPINIISKEILYKKLTTIISNNEKHVFLHANAHLIKLAQYSKNQWLVDFFNATNISVMCDGGGIQLAAKITHQIVPEKIAYNTWIWELVDILVLNNWNIFILGANEKTIIKAKENILKYNPNVKIVGHQHGYYDKSIESFENEKVIQKINNSNAHIILVGFGMPTQEKWIKENMHHLKVNALFTCGGAFDFIAGNKAVAPKWIRQIYMEWLFRSILEPKRLFYRNLSSNFALLGSIIKMLIKTNK